MFSMLNKLIKLVEDPDHHSLAILIPFLKFLGVWHPNLKSNMQRIKLLFIYIISAFFISQYVKCVVYFKSDSLKLILQYAPFHVGVAKMFYFQKDYKSWEDLVNFISFVERKQSVVKDEEQGMIVKTYLRWSRGVTYFFITLAFFSNISIFTEPYRKNQMTENETVYVNLFDGYTPFSSEPPGYYYSMAIQTLCGNIMTMYIVIWDLTAVTIMIFFVGQLRMSGLYCSRVIDVNAELSRKNIANCHEFHTTLVKYQQKFNALISPLMFIYLIIISVNLGVCIIELADTENDLHAIMSGCFFIFACMIQLLLFYWHANEVTVEPVTVPLLGKGLFSQGEGMSINHHACSLRFGDFRQLSPGFLTMFKQSKSERVSYSTFKSNWVVADFKLQRQVALLTWTTRKRLSFRAGPFNEMTLSTFIAILRSSYSFYTLLKGTN